MKIKNWRSPNRLISDIMLKNPEELDFTPLSELFFKKFSLSQSQMVTNLPYNSRSIDISNSSLAEFLEFLQTCKDHFVTKVKLRNHDVDNLVTKMLRAKHLKIPKQLNYLEISKLLES